MSTPITQTPDTRKAWHPSYLSPLETSPSSYLPRAVGPDASTKKSKPLGFHSKAASISSTRSFGSSLERIERRRSNGLPTPDSGFFDITSLSPMGKTSSPFSAGANFSRSYKPSLSLDHSSSTSMTRIERRRSFGLPTLGTEFFSWLPSPASPATSPIGAGANSTVTGTPSWDAKSSASSRTRIERMRNSGLPIPDTRFFISRSSTLVSSSAGLGGVSAGVKRPNTPASNTRMNSASHRRTASNLSLSRSRESTPEPDVWELEGSSIQSSMLDSSLIWQDTPSLRTRSTVRRSSFSSRRRYSSIYLDSPFLNSENEDPLHTSTSNVREPPKDALNQNTKQNSVENMRSPVPGGNANMPSSPPVVEGNNSPPGGVGEGSVEPSKRRIGFSPVTDVHILPEVDTPPTKHRKKSHTRRHRHRPTPLPLRNGLNAVEALVLLFACTTLSALLFSLDELEAELPNAERILWLLAGAFGGLVVCWVTHLFLGGKFMGWPEGVAKGLGIAKEKVKMTSDSWCCAFATRFIEVLTARELRELVYQFLLGSSPRPIITDEIQAKEKRLIRHMQRLVRLLLSVSKDQWKVPHFISPRAMGIQFTTEAAEMLYRTAVYTFPESNDVPIFLGRGALEVPFKYWGITRSIPDGEKVAEALAPLCGIKHRGQFRLQIVGFDAYDFDPVLFPAVFLLRKNGIKVEVGDRTTFGRYDFRVGFENRLMEWMKKKGLDWAPTHQDL
ncbi:hypothetical protein K458DRAFT_434841 [Lentithecium fluviatile CBS 122367]|uniref:Uncharacterized protein n=1 Tax=Lentithecium fluviatile CBS 122367 TaxID=1168545 RepID=A0A6G1IN78_9PLEO|nr:hypothetical protein K458DRAFT_434841 [Lentithecium fluviatile CBS 122367]